MVQHSMYSVLWLSSILFRGGGAATHFYYNIYMHYEPPGQNVSIVSQICLILVSNCLKRSQFCLKHVSDKMSQFGLNLRPFWHLRYNWDCPYLRAIWDIFLRCQKSVEKISKMSQKGIWGDLVDGRSFQVASLYIQTLWFHNYNFMV